MNDLMEELRQIGALKPGHFLLASGRHSDVYLEKFDLLRNPGATERVCSRFVEKFRDIPIDVVVGPTTGGILLAFETARQMGLPAAYAERVSDGGDAREIRRGTMLPKGSRVLVLDDILTTGGSVRETLVALERHPVEVVGIGVLVDRSNGKVRFGGISLRPLARMNVESWDAVSCPMCNRGEPLVKPGTSVAQTAS